MDNQDSNSQQANNNGNIGREVEEEHKSKKTIHKAPNPDGIAENDRHWSNTADQNISAGEADEAAKNYPGKQNNTGQTTHAENNAGTSLEDV